MMRKPVLLVVSVAFISASVACGKKLLPPPPPPVPVAPEAPPPAPPPPPPPQVAPQVDEYARLQAMSADEIEKQGLFGAVHFEFDRSDIREADRPILSSNADL